MNAQVYGQRRRRHLFLNGEVLFKRPSVISGVYPFTVYKPVPTKSGTMYEEVGVKSAFKFFIDGNVCEHAFDTEEQAKYERERLVAWTGGEAIPAEMHLY